MTDLGLGLSVFIALGLIVELIRGAREKRRTMSKPVEKPE
jgi:hypothetical protein